MLSNREQQGRNLFAFLIYATTPVLPNLGGITVGICSTEEKEEFLCISACVSDSGQEQAPVGIFSKGELV
jgi:hypothetical protein